MSSLACTISRRAMNRGPPGLDHPGQVVHRGVGVAALMLLMNALITS
jgi:hypothetical protein